MVTLALTRRGSGPPLVLLHALGSSRRVWEPVLPTLAARFDVLAVDLPGFGDSPPVRPPQEPLPTVLAAEVAATLDGLGVGAAHLVGNSLGGWVALELAHLRPAASLTLLSPAGLWTGSTPLYCRASLRATWWLTRRVPGLLHRLVGNVVGRTLVLGQTHGRPWRMTPEQARAAIRDAGTSPGFDPTLRATVPLRYVSSGPLDAPVTVAFGSRDLILPPRRARHLDELPPGTLRVPLPGCGHFPVADDPAGVAALITASTARSAPIHRQAG